MGNSKNKNQKKNNVKKEFVIEDLSDESSKPVDAGPDYMPLMWGGIALAVFVVALVLVLVLFNSKKKKEVVDEVPPVSSVVSVASLPASVSMNKENNSESVGISNATMLSAENVDDYISELADYVNLGVSVEPMKELSSDELKRLCENYLESAAQARTEYAIKNGDTVNIDYTGYMDGEKLGSYTATDVNVVVGGGEYAASIEEGLVGMKAGEKKKVDISFPEDYRNEYLAGKVINLEIKVNYISPVVSDANVLFFYDGYYENADAYVRDIYAQVKELYLEAYNESIVNAALKSVIDNSRFRYIPDAMLEKEVESIRDSLKELSESYEMDVDTLLDYAGIDTGDEAIDRVRKKIVYFKIAKEEDLLPTTEELDAYCESLIASYGSETTVAELRKNFSEEYLIYEYIQPYVDSVLYYNAYVIRDDADTEENVEAEVEAEPEASENLEEEAESNSDSEGITGE